MSQSDRDKDEAGRKERDEDQTDRKERDEDEAGADGAAAPDPASEATQPSEATPPPDEPLVQQPDEQPVVEQPVEQTPAGLTGDTGRDSARDSEPGESWAPPVRFRAVRGVAPPAETGPAVDAAPALVTAHVAPSTADAAASAVVDEVPVVEDAPVVETAELTAAATTAASPPRMVSPIEAIGTFIFNLVAFVGQALIPAPVIPAGSSVTMGRSTLEMPCGCGQTVDATWYFPHDPDNPEPGVEPPRGVIYLQHGFFRNDRAVSALAIALAEQTNSVVVTPTVTSNFFAGDGCWINGEPIQHAVADLFADRTALTASAQAAGWTGALPEQYILAGHSAGGGLAVAAAGYATHDENLAGVILFDGVSAGDDMTRALAALADTDVQVLQIASPEGVWNNFGASTADLIAARPGEFVGVRIVGGSHIDAEGRSSDLLARLLIGVPRAENVRAVQVIAAEWVNTLYGPAPVVGVSGPVGGATVVVLGSGAAVAA
ncbi:hypothetical protein H7I41_05990 [Mycobacterium manitobense]|uniref:Alpha/beta hydrolase n=1 Tax=[Mycobacterium] manitobense TaxID=190147 RepID=A0A9X3BVN5_9MYCO|nr:hypothetical protein [[Mycobacterium] manitobense]MCV7169472.1 hypothetical protein [[Mycobacterium] manitobense]